MVQAEGEQGGEEGLCVFEEGKGGEGSTKCACLDVGRRYGHSETCA